MLYLTKSAEAINPFLQQTIFFGQSQIQSCFHMLFFPLLNMTRSWRSGRSSVCHAEDRGSIPGQLNIFFMYFFSVKFNIFGLGLELEKKITSQDRQIFNG